ncbi:uncharacterized protein LOC125041261 [Penaeus chinensis]|uniref:uncharacterized protein LOC125041261 n=1 Tax=Penaeus chinensis TaxID=139456 RepID=UPI001FB74327|nr:uncharacterized protein LOC125041261 [Penaeus chinensis]
MATNSHNLNSVNGIDPQSAAHATAAEARARGTAGPICSDSMGYDAAQISVTREIDYVIAIEVPSHRAIPIPIRSEAHHMIEHGSVPSSFVGQGSLPLFGLELDPSPVHSTLERRGSQLHGIPHPGAVPFVDTPRLGWMPAQVPNSQEQMSDILHFGPVGKGETASHNQSAGSAERVKMSRISKVELSGAANHGTDYARPSSCNQNVTVDPGVCTDKRDVPGRTASTACEEDMASVVKLLQDAIPKLTNTVCMQCAASPAAHISAEDSPQPTQDGLTSSGAAAASSPTFPETPELQPEEF